MSLFSNCSPCFTTGAGAAAINSPKRNERFLSNSLRNSNAISPIPRLSQLHFHILDKLLLLHLLDALSEALLCFGASSVSIDQDDVHQSTDEESFHPVEITEGLWIVPKWRTPPDVEATNIILNPGLAFRTGEHPSTKLCLLLLHGCIKGGEYILDYSTATGLLAIATIKEPSDSTEVSQGVDSFVLGGQSFDCVANASIHGELLSGLFYCTASESTFTYRPGVWNWWN